MITADKKKQCEKPGCTYESLVVVNGHYYCSQHALEGIKNNDLR